jgi:hypothetical protein
MAMRPSRIAAALALAVVLSARAAGADQLQFRIAVSGGESYASLAEVRLTDAQNHQVFRGYTDRFGRINVPVPPGKYRAIVNASGQTKTRAIELTGVAKLRVVTLE